MKNERLEALRKRIAERPPQVEVPKSLEYQIGFLIGELIVHQYLPTLSTDMLQSYHVIEVSKEDSAENKRLHDLWSSSHWKLPKTEKQGEKEWVELRKHDIMLEKKYLPEKLECFVPPIHVENNIDLKEGIIDSLWDCDMCTYSLNPDDIEITDFLGMGDITNVNLKLKVDENYASGLSVYDYQPE